MRVLERMGELFCCLGCFVGGRKVGHGDSMWKEFGSVGDSVAVGAGDVESVTSVVFQCRANVPAVDAMVGPRCSLLWLFMDDGFGSRWG